MKNILKIIIAFWLTLQFCNVLTAQTSDTTSYQNYVNTNIVTNGTRSITATHLNYSLLSSMAISQKFRREFMDSVRAHRLRDFYNITANKISDWNTVFNWYNSNPLASYVLASSLGTNAYTSTNYLPSSGGTMTGHLNMGSWNISNVTSVSASGNISASTFNGSPLGSYAFRSTGLAETSGQSFTGDISAPNISTTGFVTVENGQFFRARRSTGGIALNVLGYLSGTNDLLLSFSDALRIRSTSTDDIGVLNTNGFGLGIDPLSGGSLAKWITLNGSTYSGGIIYSLAGSAKAYHFVSGSYLAHQAMAGYGHKLTVNNSIYGLTIEPNGNANLDGTFTATSLSGSASGLTGTASGLTAGAVDWSGVTNKPASFTPSTHTHTWSDVTGKPNLQNGTFSPTYSNLDLCTAAATETNSQWFYTVVGNVVTVTGVAYITTTSANLNSSFQFTLPLTANSSFPYYGTGHVSAEVLDVGGNSYNADITLISTTRAKVTYRANYSGTTTLFISFSYTN